MARSEAVAPHVPHDSFAKHLLDTDKDLATARCILGHGRLKTTAIYTSPSARNLV